MVMPVCPEQGRSRMDGAMRDEVPPKHRRSLLTRIRGAFRRGLGFLQRKPSRPNHSSMSEEAPSRARLGWVGKEEEDPGASPAPAPRMDSVEEEQEEEGAGTAPAPAPRMDSVEEERMEGAGAAPAQQLVEEEEVQLLQAGWELPEEQQDEERVRDVFHSEAQMVWEPLKPSQQEATTIDIIEDLSDSGSSDEMASAVLLEYERQVVRCIYWRLRFSTDESAEGAMDSTLMEMTLQSPHDVVVALLRCAPLCDGAAVTTWRAMVSLSSSAQKVLRELLEVLEDEPLHSTTSDGDSSDVLPLAATRVLREILGLPSCNKTLKEHLPRFFTALLVQIIVSTGQILGKVGSCWRGCQRGDCQQGDCPPTPPNRLAAETLRALLCHLGWEDEVSTFERGHGWEMLLHAETQHRAMGLLARAMRHSGTGERIAKCMVMRFCDKRKFWQARAMAFVIEFLDCSAMRERHEDLRHLLTVYLQSGSSVMRRMGLRGLVKISRTPSMARRMGLLLQNLVRLLQDGDTEELGMTLELLLNVLQGTHKPIVIPMALLLSERLLPLFDHDNDFVQQLSMHLFSEVMATVPEGAEEPLQALVGRSLLPLFFHLYDKKEDVAQISWLTLLHAARILKEGKLRQLLKVKKKEEIVKYLLAEHQRTADEYLQQALPYLQSPQESIREAAIRFLELVRQHMKGRQEKLQVIHVAPQGMRDDPSPSNSKLAADTLLVLSSARKSRASRSRLQVLWDWLRRAWRRLRSLWFLLPRLLDFWIELNLG